MRKTVTTAATSEHARTGNRLMRLFFLYLIALTVIGVAVLATMGGTLGTLA